MYTHLSSMNEASRLIDLLELEILDTNPEPVFDNIVAMASVICETPTALLSFIDSDRQWVKAKTGTSLTETKRDYSFCAHAINEENILIIPDATADKRFQNNPFVTGGPGIRFYAGVPFKSSNGHTLGSLCVVDTRPGNLSESQIHLLTLLANQVEELLEIRKKQNTQNAYLKELKTLSKTVLQEKNRLQYKEKIEIMRSMTRGLCHEINNPLAIIMLANTSLKRKLNKMGNLESDIQRLEKSISGAERISKIVTGLKHFSLWDSGERLPHSLRELLDETINLFVEKLRSENITLHVEYQREETILVNRGEFIQVTCNLMMNSIEAIQKQEEKWIRIKVSADHGERLKISFIDSGPGIKKDIREKIMQPFFSTKETGKGPGLGLSICQGIIKDHGGKIYLDPEGQHTCFQIELPTLGN